MNPKRFTFAAALAFVAAIGLGSTSTLAQPSFAVQPFWQRPLPDLWVTGNVSGVCLGAQDHIIIVTQGFQSGGLASPEGIGGAITSGPNIGTVSPSTSSAPVIEFDQNGAVVRAWGSKALVPAGQPFATQNRDLP